jgi:hypothetical protein
VGNLDAGDADSTGDEEGGKRLYFIGSHLRASAADDSNDGKAGDGDDEANEQQGARHAIRRDSHKGTQTRT